MGDKAIAHKHVRQAARNGAAGELGTLAQLLPENVPDDALVTPPDLRMQLLALRQRCERREGLADHLGPSARTRYRPGVRALLVGPSGTGKTLAVGWIATSLGLPLYRVDLSSVVSKYIGETEKNLAQLFARAETAEVILLFDEADAMFGKRTEQKDSNDRFANQQTNYLLQRIESFDGIAILTSNSRSRFDSAFTRRLDAIIDFPAPGPDERRALWLAHLGAQHALEIAQINRIAANCDLAGGHIRNATLAAASLTAPVDGGPVLDYGVLRQAIESEYCKLGRQVPAGL
jgi:SpoVK/Ycf46/Vps4 family AAA+-type ATPase